MIPKLHSGNNFYGVINYLESKEKPSVSKTEVNPTTQSSKGFERLGIYNLLANMTDSKSELANSFSKYNECVETKKSKTKKNVFHASLSLKEGEEVNNQKFLEIAESFMKKMGYENQPYVVYRHYDKAHPHIHIVSSRVGPDGKKIKDSNEAKKAIKICRELEIQYSLTTVRNNNSKKSKNPKELRESPTSYHPGISFKKNVVDHLSYVIRKYPDLSIAALKRYMVNNGIELETTESNDRSVVTFYGLNAAGQRISRLPGSAIGKNLFTRIKAVTKNEEIQSGNVLNRNSILKALNDINKAPIVNDAIIKAGFNSHQINVAKISCLHIPNGAKIEEIMHKADFTYNQLNKAALKGQEIKAALKEIQKRHGYVFRVITAKSGKPLIFYQEKGKSVIVNDYLNHELKKLLYENLIPKNELAKRTDDLYIKPNSALNDLLAPKLAVVYELLNKNPAFGINEIIQAGKMVGLDLSIHADASGLKGLSINYQGRLVKTSLLSDGQQSLSSSLIKGKFKLKYSGAADLHLSNEQIEILNNPPELNTLISDIHISDGILLKSIASINDKQLNQVLGEIQEKYLHKADIDHPGTVSIKEISPKDYRRKELVRSMASWLHKGVINKQKDDLIEDIYAIKIN